MLLMKTLMKFNASQKSFIYSLSAHLGLIIVLILIALQHQNNFFFGTAVRSPQQIQIVNAMLVLPQPSLSKVITPVPPAAASVPTPPTPKPDTPTKVKTTSTPVTASKTPEIQQKIQKKNIQKQTAQQIKALQKLKALGLSSIQQSVTTTQKEAASAAQAAAMLTEEEKYMGLIQQTVKSNWINQFDPNAQLIAILKIKLDAQGKVLAVTVTQSSGNSTFDRQAVLAVQKSSPLPLPPDAGLAKKFMNLTLPFNNQDLQ
jgi:TonB family protein